MMQSIGLVATDLDGTYMTSWDDTVQANIDAIQACKEQGVRVCACTGRMWSECKRIVTQHGFDPLLVTSNGASVIDSRTQAFAYTNHLTADALRAILQVGTEAGAGAIVFCSTQIHGYRPTTQHLDLRMRALDNGPALDWYRVNAYDDLDEMVQASSHAAEKVVLEFDSYDAMAQMPRRLHAAADVELTTSHGHIIEVLNRGATKATALAAIAEHYQLQPENVLALGDNVNDLSMLQWAGMGVAMGNAKDEVKQRADAVTARHDEGGFAKAIGQWVLGG